MRCVVSVPTLNTQRGLRTGMGEARGRRSMGAPEEAAVPSSRPPEPWVKAHERSRGPIDGVATSFPNSAVGGAEPNGNSGQGVRSIRDGSEGIVSRFAFPWISFILVSVVCRNEKTAARARARLFC